MSLIRVFYDFFFCVSQKLCRVEKIKIETEEASKMSKPTIDLIMKEHAKSENISASIQAAESFEFSNALDPLPPMFFKYLVASYLIRGDLTAARFAVKRSGTTTDAVMNDLHKILQSLWVKEYPVALQKLSSLMQADTSLDPFNHLLRDAIILRYVVRIASFTANFTVTECIDSKLLGVSAGTVENLVTRSGGVEALKVAAAGWSSQERLGQMQQLSNFMEK